MALGLDDLEKLKPHLGHVLLEERAQLKLKAAKRAKKNDPWAVQGEYKYPVEREIQQPSPFPILRPLSGKLSFCKLNKVQSALLICGSAVNLSAQ